MEIHDTCFLVADLEGWCAVTVQLPMFTHLYQKYSDLSFDFTVESVGVESLVPMILVIFVFTLEIKKSIL